MVHFCITVACACSGIYAWWIYALPR